MKRQTWSAWLCVGLSCGASAAPLPYSWVLDVPLRVAPGAGVVGYGSLGFAPDGRVVVAVLGPPGGHDAVWRVGGAGNQSIWTAGANQALSDALAVASDGACVFPVTGSSTRTLYRAGPSDSVATALSIAPYVLTATDGLDLNHDGKLALRVVSGAGTALVLRDAQGGVVTVAKDQAADAGSPYLALPLWPVLNAFGAIAGMVKTTAGASANEVRAFDGDGTTRLIYRNGDATSVGLTRALDAPVGINDLGEVAFRGGLVPSVYIGDGTTLRVGIDMTAPNSGNAVGARLALNNRSVVAVKMAYAGDERIVVGAGGPPVVVAAKGAAVMTPDGPATIRWFYDGIALTDNGDVAFTVSLDDAALQPFGTAVVIAHPDGIFRTGME